MITKSIARESVVVKLIDIGGKHHNDGGFFCLACGEEFTRAVRGSPSDARVSEGKQMRLEASPEMKYGSDALPVPLD